MAFDLDEEELKATRKMNKADRKDIEVGEYVRINNDFRLIALGIGKVIGINEDSIHVKMRQKYSKLDMMKKIHALECIMKI